MDNNTKEVIENISAGIGVLIFFLALFYFLYKLEKLEK